MFFFFIVYIKKDKFFICEICVCDFFYKKYINCVFVICYCYNFVNNNVDFNSLDIVKVYGILYFENYYIV